MPKWTPEDRLKAISLAQATSVREASAELNVPSGTIGRWLGELKRNSDGETEVKRNKPSKKTRVLAEEVVEEAKAEVREYVADRVKQLSQQMAEVNIAALNALKEAIERGPGEDSNSNWVRALGAIMAQGIDRQQLLEGKPTQRSEVSVSDDADRREKVIDTIRTGFDDVRKALGIRSRHDDSGDSSGGVAKVTH